MLTQPDWFALAASICHEPAKQMAEEVRWAEREERQRFADPEPEETEEARNERETSEDRRRELDYWRNS